MDQALQILLIAVALALIASIAMQIFLMGRLLSLLRSSLGRHRLSEIVDKAFEALEGVERASRAASSMVEQIKPIVEQIKPTVTRLTDVSQRQLSHADQVVGDVLTGVERVNSAIRWPAKEAHAWSAGVRTAFAALFRRGTVPRREQQW